jgi:hypothetical protein
MPQEDKDSLLDNKYSLEIEPEEDISSLPPFVKTWRQLYMIVALSLVVTVFLMYLFGKYFS